MARREVKCVRKDADGDILAIGNRGRVWSPRNKTAAISDIKSGRHSYYVNYNGQIVDVEVVKDGYKEYLKTDPDNTTSNNLDSLPKC